MKSKVLITGAGQKLGKELSNLFKFNNYSVDTISSTLKLEQNNYHIDWENITYHSASTTLDKLKEGQVYDYIIFNHNGKGCLNSSNYGKLGELEHLIWSKEYFINCQFIELCISKLLKRINNKTRVISLVSGCIELNDENSKAFSGYGSMKKTQMFLMNGYNKFLEGDYYCVNPGHLETPTEYKRAAIVMYDLVTSPVLDQFYYRLSNQYTKIEYNHVNID